MVTEHDFVVDFASLPLPEFERRGWLRRFIIFSWWLFGDDGRLMILNIPEAIHMPHEFFQTEILDSIFNRFLFITIKMNSEVRCPTIKVKRQQC